MAGFARTLKIGGAGIAMLALAIMAFLLFANYSDGTRAGVPVKFSRKGVVFKTYEGELNVGGLTHSAEGAIPTTWAFSVRGSEERVQAAMSKAMEDSKRVKLFYHQKYVKLFWRGDTNYFVYEVEILD